MMNFTINSRKLGRTLTFCARDGGGYVYVDINNQPGTLGKQPCDGGWLLGSTLWAADRTDLERQSRRWYRAYLANDLS